MANTSGLLMVTGSRNWTDSAKIRTELALLRPHYNTIVVGDCRGADSIAIIEGKLLGYTIDKHTAEWSKYGRSAGPIHNIEMLNTKPSMVLAFPLGVSKGTMHTVTEAKKRGIPVKIVE